MLPDTHKLIRTKPESDCAKDRRNPRFSNIKNQKIGDVDSKKQVHQNLDIKSKRWGSQEGKRIDKTNQD